MGIVRGDMVAMPPLQVTGHLRSVVRLIIDVIFWFA